ncbi:MAG: TIM44-like domain-containing protein [Spirochaetes bacterium]|nr:TIM44-like domain-containing protein [Spirochaetota bacterium]
MRSINKRKIMILMFFAGTLAAESFFDSNPLYPRAGRGQSYRSSSSSSSSSRSSSSSSSYRSSSSSSSSSSYKPSSPSYGSTSSYKSSSSTSSSTGTYTSGPSSPVPDYDYGYSIDSYSAVLRVNRDGTVSVTEKIKAVMSGWHNGIHRSLILQKQYAPWTVSEVKSPQGLAVYNGMNYIDAGYPKKKVSGVQEFEISYKLTGAVVPFTGQPALAWRSCLDKSVGGGSVRVEFPAGAPPVLADFRVVPGEPHRVRGKDAVAASALPGAVTAVMTRRMNPDESFEAYVVFPESAFDMNLLRALFSETALKYERANLRESRFRAVLNPDRTVDMKGDFELESPEGSSVCRMNAPLQFMLDDPIDEPMKARLKDFYRAVYYYDFKKTDCATKELGGNYSNMFGICLADRIGRGVSRVGIGYTLWGNFYDDGAHFFDFRLPEYRCKKSGRIVFELKLPEFVDSSKVRAEALLEKRYFTGEFLLRPVAAATSWDGNTLKIEYGAGLFDEQFLKVRVFIPEKGFHNPFFLRRYIMGVRSRMNFDPTWYLNYLLFGIVLATAGAVVLVSVLKGRRRDQSYERMLKTPPEVKTGGPAVDAVRSADPAFDPAKFMERAGAISSMIQAAWSAGDMKPVRNFVSQGVYNRFRLQLEMMARDEGVRNVSADYHPAGLEITGISDSKNYQTLHVKLRATIRDVTVPKDAPDDEVKKALGAAEVSSFGEIHSFTRKRGAKTDPSKDILKGVCPNCGYVPDNFGEVNKCGSCGGVYNSGEFDWVLSEITQEEEWKGGSADTVDGLKALEEKNLSVNREVIEDRASFLFWRWLDARARGKAAVLSRDATGSFLKGFGQEGRGAPFFEPAVGAVDLAGCRQEEGSAFADVLVLWSAASSKGSEPGHCEHIFTLKMPLDMKNPYGLADHSCDSCGAPLPETDALECGYCGKALQKVNSDWLLDSVSKK